MKVYNFEVENNHSYFVSGIGVLVHNADGDDYGRGNNAVNRVLEKIIGRIKTITKKYNNLKCTNCANDIEKFLKKNGYHGTRLKLDFKDGFIVSDTYGSTAISENGIHEAIMFEGKVYDNIHKNGITFEKWIDDFFSPNSGGK